MSNSILLRVALLVATLNALPASAAGRAMEEPDQVFCGLSYRAVNRVGGVHGIEYHPVPGAHLYFIPAGENYWDHFKRTRVPVTDANGVATFSYAPGTLRAGYYAPYLIEFFPGTNVIRQMAWGPGIYLDGSCVRPPLVTFLIQPV